MARRHDADQDEDDTEYEGRGAKASAPPVATKEAPPPEAPSHEGQAAYVLSSDVNIAHQDYKKGDTVMLTHDQYKTLRAADVHCVPVPQPPTEEFNQTHSRR